MNYKGLILVGLFSLSILCSGQQDDQQDTPTKAKYEIEICKTCGHHYRVSKAHPYDKKMKGYYETKELFDKVNKGDATCWCKLANSVCTDKKTSRKKSSMLKEAFEQAKKDGKILLFIGNTGG